MKSTQAEKGYGLNATVPNDNEANNDEPYVIYTVDSDPANQKVATLARCVMMCAITGAFLSFFHGIIYLTESYWFVGFFFLMGAGMCVYAGYYGAKRKDLCLLYSFAIVCAIFLGINLYEFIYEIVQLVKVGGMTDAEFLAAYPWFHSKSGYLWLGSASTVMIFAVIIFLGHIGALLLQAKQTSENLPTCPARHSSSNASSIWFSDARSCPLVLLCRETGQLFSCTTDCTGISSGWFNCPPTLRLLS